MKREQDMAFDRIVGPEGEWKDDGGARAERSEFSAREEFVFRCLNAAVNLYGVVTAEEFANLYAAYAKDKSPDVAAPVGEAEVRSLVDKVFEFQDRQENDPEADWGSDDALDFGESWFAWWKNPKTGECLFYYCSLLDDEDEDAADEAEFDPLAEKRLADLIKVRKVKEMKILAEDDFFLYEDCNGCEDSPEAVQFEKFIAREYHVSREMAEIDVMSIQAHVRINGATTTEACEYINEYCDWRPSNWAAFDRLVRALGPVLSVTRCWEYRGHTAHELFQRGLLPKFTEEKVYDVFGLDDDGDDNEYDDGEDDGYDGGDDEWRDGYEGEDDDEDIDLNALPPAAYVGPVDFRFVKDEAKREARLADYELVRKVTADFVRREVMKETTQQERKDAAKRLGIDLDNEPWTVRGTLDCVVGDFASMMDDQRGDPAIRRILARSKDLPESDRRASEYYANYRYTWLEVLAVKAGVGVKCRDLLTGEDLFLMETSYSRGDVKGATICAGIAPMGDVYFVLGVIHPANFENPETILKIVLDHLKIPFARPIGLTFADQARFAAETIRRIHANGKFATISLGNT